MLLNQLGGQRVGILRTVPVLDGNGDQVLDELMHPETVDVTVWVDLCLFEIESTAEDDTAVTTTTTEQAWCFMPVSGGQVPAVDDAGDPAPIAVSDIKSTASLISGGKTYPMRGDAVLEFDDLGTEDHVFCLCERRLG